MSYEGSASNGEDHLHVVKPPNLLLPSDLIRIKVLGMLSPFEWKILWLTVSVVAWYNFLTSLIFLLSLSLIAERIN